MGLRSAPLLQSEGVVRSQVMGRDMVGCDIGSDQWVASISCRFAIHYFH